MAAHRYWRIKSLTVTGTHLEISELQLFAGGSNVNSSATKTSSDTPSSAPGNPLSNLFDGNLSTRCFWTQAVAQGAGFWIKWDFGGSPQDIEGLKQGGYDTSGRHITAFTLEYSDDDSSWTAAGSRVDLAYPGNNTLSVLYRVPLPAGSHKYWRINGIDVVAGATLFELGELQLFEGATNVNSTSTVTSSSTPANGGLSSLTDGNLSTRNNWAVSTAEDAAFWIKWNVGDGLRAIDGVKQGGSDTATRYMAGFTLQYSDDNSSWTTAWSKSGLADPGLGTLSSLYTSAPDSGPFPHYIFRRHSGGFLIPGGM